MKLKGKKLNWYAFDAGLGYRQKRPPMYKPVLVLIDRDINFPFGVAVGYRKNAAGCKDSPYFVVPHVGYGETKIIAWCDCLPNEDVVEFFNFDAQFGTWEQAFPVSSQSPAPQQNQNNLSIRRTL